MTEKDAIKLWNCNGAIPILEKSTNIISTTAHQNGDCNCQVYYRPKLKIKGDLTKTTNIMSTLI